MTTRYSKSAETQAVIVPANPGFFIVEWCDNDDGTFAPLETPIIAWRIVDEDGIVSAKPITPDWCIDDSHNDSDGPIKYPDGQVRIAGGTCYASLAEATKDRNLDRGRP